MLYLKVNVFISNVLYDKRNTYVSIYDNKFIPIANIKKILLQIIFIQINLCKCLHSTGELLPVSLSTCTRSIQCCIMLLDIAVAEKVVSLGVVQNISDNAV